VIARLRELDGRLPREDGIAWFNLLYLRVTERVEERLRAGRFRRPRFLARLDVLFAGLYFDALEADRRAPRPWRELIERRERADIAPVQFALAGMNAHITYDLPIALVETSRELGWVAVDRGTAEHEDFEDVNGILESVEDEVVRSLEAGPAGGGLVGRMEERLALWSVVTARDRAWRAAARLIHESDLERSETLAGLARDAGRLSQLLLDC
jgi:hypothetical protein